MSLNNNIGNETTAIPEGCHFPVSTATSTEKECWKYIPIAHIDDHLSAGCQLYGSLDAFVRASWKLLLQTYIGEDTTSFAFFNSGNIDGLSTTMCRDDNFHVETQASICSYYSASGDFNKPLQPSLNLPFCDAIIRQSELNSAIHICFTSSDEIYARWMQSQHQQSEMQTVSSPESFQQGLTCRWQFDLILFVNTFTNLSKLNLCFRCPRVPLRYGKAVTDSFRSILIRLSRKDNKSLIDNSNAVNFQTIQEWKPESFLNIESCVHDEIVKVVEAIPLQEAACAWDGSLTYRELWNLSSIVAKHLIWMGLPTGSFVPFIFEKSLWAVVAALAIIKAGGALVPINPDHPEGRRDDILQNTNATIAVTSKTHCCLLSRSTVNVVTVSSENVHRWANEHLTGICLPQVTPKDPIFVLFTSGSTGQPKGMVHEHGGICSHATGQIQTMGYRGARVFQFSAFTFDVAMMDIFTTLMAAGCVCIPSDSERISNLAGAMERMRVNYALLTPSIAALLDPRDVPGLKTLALAGESLRQTVIDRWVDHVWLMNAYGPAEVGVCTLSTVRRETRPETIGHPISHSSCWVVHRDDHNQLSPVGAVGELLVAGTTIARGYLNNKTKTEAAFIRSPLWATRFGACETAFYKTGDLVRYNIGAFDGSLDYIGRKDTQIKIRGQRVELGDIEHHLATVPGVLRSIVSFPKEGYYAGNLVAVLQTRDGLDVDPNGPLCLDHQQVLQPDAIQSYLACSMLSHMIPTEYVTVQSLPLDPSCKIDRKRVNQWLTTFSPTPTKSSSRKCKTFAALRPSESIARAICDKICAIVGQKDTHMAATLQGCHFSLSGLGLDSIQLMSISMHLRKMYHVHVSISRLNSPHATVRGLADFIQRNKADEILPIVNVIEEANAILKMLAVRSNPKSPVQALQLQKYPQNVLLTGASGFLGLEILRQLLSYPSVHVFTVVRCSAEEDGIQRLRSSAKKNRWWHEVFAARIHIWSGDLSKPQLGLPLSALHRLVGQASESDNIHAVIHCGARVQYNHDYGSLKATNVDSTTQLLEITAQSTSIGTFLYISGGVTPNIRESDGATDVDLALMNGYSQSKLISELVVQGCAAYPAFQGRRIRVIRPGYIIGSAVNPTAVQTDFIWRLVAACLSMESYNADADSQWLYISDVERVAQVMVADIFEQPGSVIMDAVLDGLPVGEFWSLLTADFGYLLQPLSEAKWVEKLASSIAREEESHPLFPFLHILEGELKSVGSRARLDMDSGPVRDAIRGNIQHLIEAGFLPAPLSSSGKTGTHAVGSGHA